MGKRGQYVGWRFSLLQSELTNVHEYVIDPVVTAVKKEGVAGSSNPSSLPSSAPADNSSSTLPLPEATKTSPVYSLDVQVCVHTRVDR